jgi:hypothetical protein
MAEQFKTNVDESRSPIVIPYAILGGLSVLALLGAVVALGSN